jgi:16S rRNA U516 pseudouridylate synthase RsuA-like enzyme
LVLTDDKLLARIADPSTKLTKTYQLQVEGAPTDTDLQTLRDGVTLNVVRACASPATPAALRHDHRSVSQIGAGRLGPSWLQRRTQQASAP